MAQVDASHQIVQCPKGHFIRAEPRQDPDIEFVQSDEPCNECVREAAVADIPVSDR